MGPDPSKVRIQQLKGSGKSEFEIRIHTIKIKNRKETRLTDKTSPSPVRTFLIWHFLIINNNLITVFSLKINSVTTCIPAQIWIQSRGTFLDPDPNKLYLYPQHCAKQIFVPYLFTYLIVQRTSSSIICGMYSWTAGGLDPIYTCLILCSSCVENKFIDYLRDVQLDRWLDWTLERDQEPYTSQVHILYSRVADPE